MAIARSLFVKKVPKDLLCGICGDVPEKAVVAKCACDVIYCKSCFSGKSKRKCRSCTRKLSSMTCKLVPSFNLKISGLQMKCSYHAKHNCKTTSCLRGIKIHEKSCFKKHDVEYLRAKELKMQKEAVDHDLKNLEAEVQTKMAQLEDLINAQEKLTENMKAKIDGWKQAEQALGKFRASREAAKKETADQKATKQISKESGQEELFPDPDSDTERDDSETEVETQESATQDSSCYDLVEASVEQEQSSMPQMMSDVSEYQKVIDTFRDWDNLVFNVINGTNFALFDTNRGAAGFKQIIQTMHSIRILNIENPQILVIHPNEYLAALIAQLLGEKANIFLRCRNDCDALADRFKILFPQMFESEQIVFYKSEEARIGFPLSAPYDLIIVNDYLEAKWKSLSKQLKSGGKLMSIKTGKIVAFRP